MPGNHEAPAGVARSSWLSRNLVLLTLVSLTQDAASELLYPLLPLLLTGPLAAPPVVLGLTEGLADATAGVTRYVSGRWSDRRGRRPFIGAGYALAAVGKVLVAAATAWPVVLAGRVVDRFGKGVRSAPRDALIASTVPREARGRAFGFHRTGDSVGAVIGPLLGLAALEATDGDLRAALWWAVMPATASALLVLLVREPTRPAAARPVRSPGSGRSSVPLPPAYWSVVVPLVAVAVVNFSDALLLLRLHELGFSTTEVILAYAAFNAVYTVASYPAGALTDRWPPSAVYAGGLLAFATGYLGLGLSRGGWPTVAFVTVYGLFPALTDGVGKAWVSTLVDDGHQGRAQGVYQALNNGAVLVAGTWAGLAWGLGPGDGVVPLCTSGAAAVVGAALLARSARQA